MEFIQAELNDPDYKDPSVLSYILHGWLNVYKASISSVDIKRYTFDSQTQYS